MVKKLPSVHDILSEVVALQKENDAIMKEPDGLERTKRFVEINRRILKIITRVETLRASKTKSTIKK